MRVYMLAIHGETTGKPPQRASEDDYANAPKPETTPVTLTEDLQDLVNRIREDDAAAMEGLYRIFARGIRFYLCRQLGPQELEDKVHDTFVIVVQAIRKGELREPDRLMGY